ncbi:uncharacterized protein LOC120254665 [Dioscorea cayenensis subsp. rotundata]|uniref:Uncharacterized protein LOC120254665 n=1 Tax=Dioscorea cayennensis subsp. rotundata TaxID=55577 RepID=A0AB40AUY6_DIOCR|nr:uncharacterized protein LOC120254665 [Dioscorea cayenensis subsp. rotundata]
MKIFFRSQRLWKIIEEGFSKEKPSEKDLEDDAKALFLLQQAVDETILHRIVRFDSAKEAWDHLKNENQGTSRMVSIRQQALRQRFDLLQMREDETIQHYITRVLAVVNQIRGMGTELKDAEIVLKVLRSLSSRFVHAVTSIEEARDMSTLSLDELSGSLQAHEARFNQFSERHEAFVMQGNFRGGRMRGRGRNFRGRGRAEINPRGGDQRQAIQQQGQQYTNERGRGGPRFFGRVSRGQRQYGQRGARGGFQNVQCFKCKKYGHYQSHCWSTQSRNSDEGSSSSVNMSSIDYGSLFMVHNGEELHNSSIWLLDSGTSCHMTSRRELFHNLDETLRHKVRLGDDKEVDVLGKGSVAIQVCGGETKLIHGVQFVPSLAHNLLSVGQLVEGGYDVMNVARKDEDLGMLWHRRYGHLNFQGLQVLAQHNLVTVQGKTPHEAWFGIKPNVSHLRIFGCIAFVHVPTQNLQKLDNRAVKGVFLGYCIDAKAYKIFVPDHRKILERRMIIARNSRSSDRMVRDAGTTKSSNAAILHQLILNKQILILMRRLKNQNIGEKAMKEEFDAIQKNETWKTL